MDIFINGVMTNIRYGYGIWLWDMVMGYGYGIWLWDMVMGYGLPFKPSYVFIEIINQIV